jgi:hypothetical protein
MAHIEWLVELRDAPRTGGLKSSWRVLFAFTITWRREIAAVIAVLGLILFVELAPVLAPQFLLFFNAALGLSLLSGGLTCLIFLKRW